MNSTSLLSPPPFPAQTLDSATANSSFPARPAHLLVSRQRIQARRKAVETTTTLLTEGVNLIVNCRKQSNLLNCFAFKSSDMVSDEKSSKLLTLPTLLTLGRVAAVPVFIATYYVNSWWGITSTTSIFVAAAITDWLDGYLARKMDLGSAFGAFLDPVADKLMVGAALVLLCSRPPGTAVVGHLPWLFPVPAIAIVGREITMSAVREWAASQNPELLQAVAVNNLGKWKTATQMAALTILLSTRDIRLAGRGDVVISGVVLLYISAGLAVWSLVVYMKKIWSVLLK